MDKLIMAIATGLYAGYLPKAPGTWGTLVAFPLHLLLIHLPRTGYFAALAIILVLAIVTAGSAEKILDRPDARPIVIDEITGMLIGLIGAPVNVLPLAVAFLLFRLFDIVKPFPAGWVDAHLHGGVGIVLDDVVAGLYTLLVMQILKVYLW